MQLAWAVFFFAFSQVLLWEGARGQAQRLFAVKQSSNGYLFTPVNRWNEAPQLADGINWGQTPPLAGNYTAESYAARFGWQFVILFGGIGTGCTGGACGRTVFTVIQAYLAYVQFLQTDFTNHVVVRANAPPPGSTTPTAVRVVNSRKNRGLWRLSAASKLTPGIAPELEARELTRSYPLMVGTLVPKAALLRGGGRQLLGPRGQGRVGIFTATNAFFPLGQIGQCGANPVTQGPTSCDGGHLPLKSCAVGADGCLSCTSTCAPPTAECPRSVIEGFRTPPRRFCRRVAFVQSFWPVGPDECCNRVCLPVFYPPVHVNCH